MNAEELAGLLLSDPERALERGTDALQQNPSGAAQALEGLLGWRDLDVQMWAVELIPKVLGEAGAPLLLKACSHSDPDVRIDALNALATLSPQTARRLIPRLKRQLNEDDPYEPVAALWALARVGDPESLPAVEEVSRSVDRGWLPRSLGSWRTSFATKETRSLSASARTIMWRCHGSFRRSRSWGRQSYGALQASSAPNPLTRSARTTVG